MDKLIRNFGNIPITSSIIESLYSDLKSTDKKVLRLEKQGYIIRLKRGLYVLNPEYSGVTLSTELIANHLYAPSYISMSTALRYYGLIPETVYTNQSMTIKCAREFRTPIGNFDYKYISKQAFYVGIRSVNNDGYAFIIASPEKALCDLVANSTKVNLRYQKEVEIYLEEDIRMDMDEFFKLDASIFEEYIKVGKKADSIKTILKFLRK